MKIVGNARPSPFRPNSLRKQVHAARYQLNHYFNDIFINKVIVNDRADYGAAYEAIEKERLFPVQQFYDQPTPEGLSQVLQIAIQPFIVRPGSAGYNHIRTMAILALTDYNLEQFPKMMREVFFDATFQKIYLASNNEPIHCISRGIGVSMLALLTVMPDKGGRFLLDRTTKPSVTDQEYKLINFVFSKYREEYEAGRLLFRSPLAYRWAAQQEQLRQKRA